MGLSSTRGCWAHLEDAGSIRGAPGVEQVVLPRAHKPLPCGRRQSSRVGPLVHGGLGAAGTPQRERPKGSSAARTAGGELEGEDAALVQVQLVLVGLGVVHAEGVGALHAQRGPQAQGCRERWCQRMWWWVWGCARCPAMLTQGVHRGFGGSGAELWGTAGSRGYGIALRCGGAGLEAGCPRLLHLLGQNNVTLPSSTHHPQVLPPSLNPARYKGSPPDLQPSSFPLCGAERRRLLPAQWQLLQPVLTGGIGMDTVWGRGVLRGRDNSRAGMGGITPQ
uniref:Uncharacterized protein n=1 Tax=Coturnix japonica TaxID=93934 RepID=A0A8C2TBW8_COTJA